METHPENHPENLAAAYKEKTAARFEKPTLSGGAGDVSLSPSHVHRHTPGASLGAVCGPACAPLPGAGSQAQPDPLATPGLLRFLLGKSASDMLAASGNFFLIEAHRSPRPEDDGRFVMLALPITKDAADSAARVAKGTHRAVKIKPTPSPA
jgi:hypothetical protein